MDDSELERLIQLLGDILKEMRLRRRLSQSDVDMPSRTVRRIEKGEIPVSQLLKYARQLGPCFKELARCFDAISDAICPVCKRCDPDCRFYGKSCDTERRIPGRDVDNSTEDII
jgi:hypothetical protein